MTATISFFPVGNGDMTLVKFDNGQTLLIDINIRSAADDEDDDTPDVASDLRDRLDRDDKGRLYVDAMLLSHPDSDHCTGLRNHFHLDDPADWVEDDDKIVIREMWSSPIVFRRACKSHVLCDDAKAWAKEARRRVAKFKEIGFSTVEGDRIVIMGEDVDGKTDEIMDIVVKVDESFAKLNRINAAVFEGRLLAPLPPSDDEEEEELLAKNRSSVVIRFAIAGDGYPGKCHFLTGGDAGVAVWDRLWEKHKDSNPEWFEYDLLQTPHHCSWRSLSYDSWSEHGEDAEVDPNARDALSQTLEGAVIVATCKAIKADDDNPPHERAKREYLTFVDNDDERFYCTGEYPDEDNPETLEFSVKSTGPEKKRQSSKIAAAAVLGVGSTAQQPRAHGNK